MHVTVNVVINCYVHSLHAELVGAEEHDTILSPATVFKISIACHIARSCMVWRRGATQREYYGATQMEHYGATVVLKRNT